MYYLYFNFNLITSIEKLYIQNVFLHKGKKRISNFSPTKYLLYSFCPSYDLLIKIGILGRWLPIFLFFFYFFSDRAKHFSFIIS